MLVKKDGNYALTWNAGYLQICGLYLESVKEMLVKMNEKLRSRKTDWRRK